MAGQHDDPVVKGREGESETEQKNNNKKTRNDLMEIKRGAKNLLPLLHAPFSTNAAKSRGKQPFRVLTDDQSKKKKKNPFFRRRSTWI